MIIRVVNMHFHPEHVVRFRQIFNESCEAIRTTHGCRYLELCQSTLDPGSLTTISHWDSEEELNAYRQSDLFQKTWAQTKALFSAKPQASSFYSVTRLP